MASFIRETFAGDVLRWAGLDSTLQHPEEASNYIAQLPIKYTSQTSSSSETSSRHSASPAEGDPEKSDVPKEDSVIVVDWDGADDAANPRNWSSGKKLWVVTIVW